MHKLEIIDVKKSFGDVTVLSGVSLFIDSGTTYTIIGGNGSGKTTLVNVISGFVKPDSGTVFYDGVNLADMSPHLINRLGIGRTFQDLRLARYMTVRENVTASLERKMFGSLHKEDIDRIETILARMSLSSVADAYADNISFGQQKLLTLACLIANNSDLLLIDEPIAGIDKDNRQKIVSIMDELKDEGKTIIQIEHNCDYIARTSDCILKMENGRIVC